MKKEENVIATNEDATKSLMRKTKAQLAEIIVRKDLVETKLRTDLRKSFDEKVELQEEIKVLANKCEKYGRDYFTLKHDYEEACDEHASQITEYHMTVSRYKALNFIYVFVILLMVLIMFII